jgi:hypothetical protein
MVEKVQLKYGQTSAIRDLGFDYFPVVGFKQKGWEEVFFPGNPEAPIIQKRFTGFDFYSEE